MVGVDRKLAHMQLILPYCVICECEYYSTHASMQDRAFLGVTTLKELVLKRPHGPRGTEDFLQVLLEITLSNIELVC